MSRILIIDDDVLIRRVLRSILEQAGHTVLDASDGGEGMALWRQEPTDVVVTDVFMAGKDGMHVLLEMQHVAPKPKIIVMSGGGQKGLLDWRVDALALGAEGVLEKPFDPGLVLSTLNAVLSRPTQGPDPACPSRVVDQRKFPRKPVSLAVSFGSGAAIQRGTVLDISREGCRIQSPDVAPDMKYFEVEIQLGELQGILRVDLAVRRWSKVGEFGVEFIRMKPEQQTKLLQVLQSP